ncbi:hypothetical protein [Streptomyces mirabilis]|uniref:hypothetical protein n=1 Tax=Streptomyces mirabilis TaxID=68239 RepID=UPI003318029D
MIAPAGAGTTLPLAVQTSILTVRVIARTPRCVVPTLAHGALPPVAAALRVLADYSRVIPLESMRPQPCAGVYAQVPRPGPIQLGDPVRWA